MYTESSSKEAQPSTYNELRSPQKPHSSEEFRTQPEFDMPGSTSPVTEVRESSSE